MDSIPLKRCSQCGKEYPPTAEYFPTRKDRPSGLKSYCRQCHRNNTTVYRENNRDKVLEGKKRYYSENTDKIKKQIREWMKDNPDKVRGQAQRNRKRHPARIRVNDQRRRHRKNAVLSTFTPTDRQRALEYFHGCCAYCGNPPSLFDSHCLLHQEHFSPLSKGGGYTLYNIIPACQSCNLSKNDKEAPAWLIEHFGKHKAKVVLKNIQDYFASLA